MRAARAQLELGPNGLMLSDAEGTQRKVELPDANPFVQELAYFQKCCDEGRRPDRCPPEASAAVVKMALSMKRSRELDGEEVPCVL